MTDEPWVYALTCDCPECPKEYATPIPMRENEIMAHAIQDAGWRIGQIENEQYGHYCSNHCYYEVCDHPHPPRTIPRMR